MSARKKLPFTPGALCRVDSCERPLGNRATGLCKQHRDRMNRRPDSDVNRPINSPKLTLADKFWMRVEKADGCWNWTWSVQSKGYGTIAHNGKQHLAHRVSYEMAYGEIPAGAEVDHSCNNTRCVRPDHLRVASRKQNMENLGNLRADNTSGHRGVSWNSRKGKWSSSVQHHGKPHFLGYFDDLDEAAEAARKKRLELFTHNHRDAA